VTGVQTCALPISSLPTPYWEEQLGFSVIEAMAAGLPVLAVASGSLPYVVEGGALFVTPYDVDDLSRGLTRLATEPALASELSDAGAERARTIFNTSVVAPALGDIIDRTLSR